jgi:hypothetical protein
MTLVFSLTALRYGWTRRTELLTGDSGGAPAAP